MVKKVIIGLILSLLFLSSINAMALTVNTNEQVISTEDTTQEYTLTVITFGPGSVTPSGGTYEAGTEVLLTAFPELGFKFRCWSYDLHDDSNPVTIVMDSDKLIYAEFIAEEPLDLVPTVSAKKIAGKYRIEVYVTNNENRPLHLQAFLHEWFGGWRLYNKTTGEELYQEPDGGKLLQVFYDFEPGETKQIWPPKPFKWLYYWNGENIYNGEPFPEGEYHLKGFIFPYYDPETDCVYYGDEDEWGKFYEGESIDFKITHAKAKSKNINFQNSLLSNFNNLKIFEKMFTYF